MTMTSERRKTLLQRCNCIFAGLDRFPERTLAKLVGEILDALPVTDEGEVVHAGPAMEAVMRNAAFASTEHQYDLAAPVEGDEA